MQINNSDKKGVETNADYIAKHYGFDLIQVEEKTFKKETVVEDEKIKILKKVKKDLTSKRTSPLKMFFYKKPISKKDKNDSSYGIDILNIDSSIAEATIIRTVNSILEEEGYIDIKFTLNAIGDTDSVKNFKQALTTYYRQHRTDLKAVDVKKITKAPLDLFYNESQKEYLKIINKNAPSPLEFLSEKSIKHFQEVIEYLDNFNIDYIIDEKMQGSKLFFSKIIFKITAKGPKEKESSEVGFGGRYDEIAQEKFGKKKVSAIGLNLNFKKKSKVKVKLTNAKINIHLLKIGSTAKLKYLDVIDIFSKMKIPIKYDIKEEKISKQIKKVTEDEADYSVIIGEVESKKNKVLIRKMKDYSQQEVDIKNLAPYIKKLSK